MKTIQALFQEAQLAQAAYADFSILGRTTQDALLIVNGGKFTEAATAAFVARYEVVNPCKAY